MLLFFLFFFFFKHSDVIMPFYVNADIGDEDTQLLNKVTTRAAYSDSKPLFDAKVYMELMLPLVTRWSRTVEYLLFISLFSLFFFFIFLFYFLFTPPNLKSFYFQCILPTLSPHVWSPKFRLKGFTKSVLEP